MRRRFLDPRHRTIAGPVLWLPFLALASCTSSSSSSADAGDPIAGPLFLSFSSNTELLFEDQTLTVTAVLTDPDGIDDIIGGALIDPDSGRSYGAFQTSASEGSYAISLGWLELDTVVPISGTTDGMLERRLAAEFFDTAGHRAQRELVIGLDCTSEIDLPCGSGCLYGYEPDEYGYGYCGECGHTCEPRGWMDPGSSTCHSADGGSCGGTKTVGTPIACGDVCSAFEQRCVLDNTGSAGWTRYEDGSRRIEGCDHVPAARTTLGAYVSQTCDCAEP